MKMRHFSIALAYGILRLLPASATIVDVPVIAIAPGVDETVIDRIEVSIPGATSFYFGAGYPYVVTTGYFDLVTFDPSGGGLTPQLRPNLQSTGWNEATQAGFSSIVNKQPAPLFYNPLDPNSGLAAWGNGSQFFDQITFTGTLGKLQDPDAAQYGPVVPSVGTVLDLIGVQASVGDPDLVLSQAFIDGNGWSIKAYDQFGQLLPLSQNLLYIPFNDPRALALTKDFFFCSPGDPSASTCAGAALIQLQVAPDTDGDGFLDSSDNCTLVANPSQCDSDGDGYGNHCDGDLNNNGFTNAFDTPLYRAQIGQPSVAPTYNQADINCNGFVNAFDTPLFRQLIGSPPGPSGLNP